VFNIVLYQPEIPPNTGNIIRLCANTGCRLHLIEPLGFEPDDAKLRRAGLDYGDWAQALRHNSFEEYLVAASPARLFTFSTHHMHLYTEVSYRAGDALLFGPETRGLPKVVRDGVPEECRLRLPMLPGNRSLNLSNAVAVVVYEAWRQLGFTGTTGKGER
jgi:tRNA (cytidine/uridine-2'-O-)-methyltransferase